LRTERDSLARTLAAFEEKFHRFFDRNRGGGARAMEWVNFGGGHHITRADYDVDFAVRSHHGIQAGTASMST